MTTQENLDKKEAQRENLVDKLEACYKTIDNIKRKIGVIDGELRALYQKRTYERKSQGTGN